MGPKKILGPKKNVVVKNIIEGTLFLNTDELYNLKASR